MDIVDGFERRPSGRPAGLTGGLSLPQRKARALASEATAAANRRSIQREWAQAAERRLLRAKMERRHGSMAPGSRRKPAGLDLELARATAWAHRKRAEGRRRS